MILPKRFPQNCQAVLTAVKSRPKCYVQSCHNIEEILAILGIFSLLKHIHENI